MKYLVLFFVLLFLLLTAAGFPFQAGSESAGLFLGTWAGSLTAAGVTLEFTITFSLDKSAQLAGTIDIPAQGAAGIQLGNIKVDGSKISFAIADPGAQGNPTFEGTLKDTKKTIAGTFSQSGITGTFSIDKKGPDSL